MLLTLSILMIIQPTAFSILFTKEKKFIYKYQRHSISNNSPMNVHARKRRKINVSKLITFTFNTKYTDQIQETFSFEQLGINEQLPSDEIKKTN